ncbi:leucine-rich single-pass membrane protein 2 isoform X3 [Sus scrofa]|uniref:leucine-rich single-pass membrane protein 2 isoform X3 n=1 Tax=Sus scrofa TaxID=9823 RepID=UPI000A2AFC33|nr:leucine-rich single-pass membrane protein 2 isoform X3 [Sus scrofa]
MGDITGVQAGRWPGLLRGHRSHFYSLLSCYWARSSAPGCPPTHHARRNPRSSCCSWRPSRRREGVNPRLKHPALPLQTPQHQRQETGHRWPPITCRRCACTGWSPSAIYTAEVHCAPTWRKRRSHGTSFWVSCLHHCAPRPAAALCTVAAASCCCLRCWCSPAWRSLSWQST